MEYIPHAISTSPWKDPNTTFDKLDKKSQKVLHDVRKFLELMESKKIVLDPKPANFRLDAAGTLYLVDFTEEPDACDLLANLDLAIRLWSGTNQHICNFLKANLSHPDIQKMSCVLDLVIPIKYPSNKSTLEL